MSHGLVRYVVADDSVVCSMNCCRTLKRMVHTVIAVVCFFADRKYVNISSRREVVPVSAVASQISRLAGAEKLNILDPHFTTKKCTGMAAKLVRIPWLRGCVIALNQNVPRQQSNSGTEISRCGVWIMPVPDAEMLALQRLI